MRSGKKSGDRRLMMKKVLKCCLVLLIVSLFFVQTAWACTWNGAANKCIPGNGEVVAYKHASCKGMDYFVFSSGFQPGYADLDKFVYVSGAGSLNDSISCFDIGPRTVFNYYEDINFGGRAMTICNNRYDRIVNKNIGKTRWNDVISSVKIFDVK